MYRIYSYFKFMLPCLLETKCCARGHWHRFKMKCLPNKNNVVMLGNKKTIMIQLV